jgi:hypothetical protein
MKLSKKELDSVLDKVTAEFEDIIKSAEAEEGQPLSKADPGTQTSAEQDPDGSSTAPPAPEGSPSAETSAPPSSPSPEGAAPPAEGPPADASAGAPGGDGMEGQVSYAQIPPEQLAAEIGKLPVEDQKALFLATKTALMASMGGDGAPPADASPEASASAAPPAASPSAPPAAAGAPPAASPSASPAGSPEEPPMGKGEFDDKSGKVSAGSMKKNEDHNGFGDRLAKAEGLIATLQKSLADKTAENAALESAITEKLGPLAAGIQKIVERSNTPMRKSVRGVAEVQVIGKPGDESATKSKVDVSTLTKSEVTAKLRDLTAPGGAPLAKKDNDAVKAFMVGSAGIESVAHLLG